VVALRELADQLGFTGSLSSLLRETSGQPRFQHDRGRVLRDLAVTIADGGDCLTDLAVLQDQPDLFGGVATTPTAWRVVDGSTESDLEALRMARAHARERAWRGRQLEEVVLDIDATVSDHLELLDMALAQLPEWVAELPILVRTVSSGASPIEYAEATGADSITTDRRTGPGCRSAVT